MMKTMMEYEKKWLGAPTKRTEEGTVLCLNTKSFELIELLKVEGLYKVDRTGLPFEPVAKTTKSRII